MTARTRWRHFWALRVYDFKARTAETRWWSVIWSLGVVASIAYTAVLGFRWRYEDDDEISGLF